MKKTEREVLLYLYDIIEKNDNKCPPLRLIQIASDLKYSYPVVCGGLNSFIRRGWIRKTRQEKGREAFVKYEIDTYCRSIIISYLTMANMEGSAFVEEMPHDVKVIIPSDLIDIGFRENVISQLKREGFALKLIQESLDAFCYDIKKRPEYIAKIKSPIAWFITVFKKNEGYYSVYGYVSDEEKMIEESIKAKKIFIDKKEQRGRDLFEISFKEWIQKHTPNELVDISPPIPGTEVLGMIHLSELKEVFKRQY
jgi:hypothetical protein